MLSRSPTHVGSVERSIDVAVEEGTRKNMAI